MPNSYSLKKETIETSSCGGVHTHTVEVPTETHRTVITTFIDSKGSVVTEPVTVPLTEHLTSVDIDGQSVVVPVNSHKTITVVSSVCDVITKHVTAPDTIRTEKRTVTVQSKSGATHTEVINVPVATSHVVSIVTTDNGVSKITHITVPLSLPTVQKQVTVTTSKGGHSTKTITAPAVSHRTIVVTSTHSGEVATHTETVPLTVPTVHKTVTVHTASGVRTEVVSVPATGEKQVTETKVVDGQTVTDKVSVPLSVPTVKKTVVVDGVSQVVSAPASTHRTVEQTVVSHGKTITEKETVPLTVHTESKVVTVPTPSGGQKTVVVSVVDNSYKTAVEVPSVYHSAAAAIPPSQTSSAKAVSPAQVVPVPAPHSVVLSVPTVHLTIPSAAPLTEVTHEDSVAASRAVQAAVQAAHSAVTEAETMHAT